MPFLTRIFMVFTLVAGLAAIGIEMLIVKPAKLKLQADLNSMREVAAQEKSDKESQQKAKEEALDQLKNKEQMLKEAATESERIKSALASASSKAKEAEQRLAEVSTEVKTLKSEIEKYTTSLPKGMTIEQVRTKLSDMQEELTTLDQERNILNEQLIKLDVENKKLHEQAQLRREGKMPPGLTGHVLAVNRDWNFVVLDIGGNQGVIENVPMIVYRDRVLVGKVKITSVEPSISIADILTDWKQQNIQEGDTVIF